MERKYSKQAADHD